MSSGATNPVQIFGRADSRPTQKALRFFRERRVPTSFVNLAQRPMAPGELRRFVQKFTAAALVDVNSRAYREGGLSYLRLTEQEMEERLTANQALLLLPLVRFGNRLSVGADEAAWKEILAASAN